MGPANCGFGPLLTTMQPRWGEEVLLRDITRNDFQKEDKHHPLHLRDWDTGQQHAACALQKMGVEVGSELNPGKMAFFILLSRADLRDELVLIQEPAGAKDVLYVEH